MRSCQCETGLKCSRLEGGGGLEGGGDGRDEMEGEYHIMVNRLLAAIKRLPRSHRAILLRDGRMNEILIRGDPDRSSRRGGGLY